MLRAFPTQNLCTVQLLQAGNWAYIYLLKHDINFMFISTLQYAQYIITIIQDTLNIVAIIGIGYIYRLIVIIFAWWQSLLRICWIYYIKFGKLAVWAGYCLLPIKWVLGVKLHSSYSTIAWLTHWNTEAQNID